LDARRTAGLEIGWEKLVDLKSSPLADFIEGKKAEVKNLEKEIKKLQGGQINVDELASKAKTFKTKSGSAKVVMADVALDDREVLSQVTDHLKNKIQSGVVVVVGQGGATHPLIVSVSKDLNPEVSAGNLLKEIAQVMGGKGGGRPDFAQGAVPDRSKIQQAFAAAEKLLGL
jgi:alanyl-tRNA synthetase